MNTNDYDKAMQESCTTDCIHYRQGTCPYRYNMKLECTRFRMFYGYQPEEPAPPSWWDDHEALKREYCRMLKSHVLLVEMLYERDMRIRELEQGK